MHDTQRRTKPFLWGGLLLLGLAVVAVVIPAVGYGRAASKGGVTLKGQHAQVTLPAHQRYGIYVDDTDNSGYSEQCLATDVEGHPVQLHDPGPSISSSDTETLDFVFNTGTGSLVIDCEISAERVVVKPVPNFAALLGGFALALLAGCAGVILLVVWHARRSPPAAAAHVQFGAPITVEPPSGWYPDPQFSGRWRYWDGRAWTEHMHG